MLPSDNSVGRALDSEASVSRWTVTLKVFELCSKNFHPSRSSREATFLLRETHLPLLLREYEVDLRRVSFQKLLAQNQGFSGHIEE